ncbi:glycosyltransferase family 2 protein [Bacillus kwashiorkori]|uniref:glycosyltransferase family 2 protein n=1 Tax=Bacillus kwashiorkori TaxID=1522318 RepID=UPI0007867955|nr:glycosyltransferase family 2 protein [Bacillus kwashiorkori]
MDRQQQLPKLFIVVPCYNEEEVLLETIKQLSNTIQELVTSDLVAKESKILFVDDGSRDKTWAIIAKASVANEFVTGMKLAKNVGHQKALLAGLHKAAEVCDCAISIDADLQDDITVIRQFVEKYHDGYDIVYGVRDSRDTDSFFKKNTALFFYRLMERLGIQLVYNHADFRLLSTRALRELLKYEESNLFLRGIIPLLGYSSTKVYYDRKKRLAGESKYPLKKMLSFAFDGLTSFSIAPIRLITSLGFLLFFIGVITGSYALFQKFLGATTEGWTSLMISIWFIGGLQLISIGMIGEYIGKVFTEVKRRPKYAVDIDLLERPILSRERDNIIHLEEKDG